MKFLCNNAYLEVSAVGLIGENPATYTIIFNYIFLILVLFLVVHTYKMSSRSWAVLIHCVLFFFYFFCFLFVTLSPLSANSWFIAIALIIVILNLFTICLENGGGAKVLDTFSEDVLQENHIGFTKKGMALHWTTNIRKKVKNKKPVEAFYGYCITLVLILVNLVVDTRVLILVFVGYFRSSADYSYFPLAGLVFLLIYSIVILCFDLTWKKNFEEITGPKTLHYIGFNTTTTKLIEVSSSLVSGGIAGELSSSENSPNSSSHSNIDSFADIKTEEKSGYESLDEEKISSKAGVVLSPTISTILLDDKNSVALELAEPKYPINPSVILEAQLPGVTETNIQVGIITAARSAGDVGRKLITSATPAQIEAVTAAIISAATAAGLTNPDGYSVNAGLVSINYPANSSSSSENTLAVETVRREQLSVDRERSLIDRERNNIDREREENRMVQQDLRQRLATIEEENKALKLKLAKKRLCSIS